MAVKYFVDGDGKYLGGFDGHTAEQLAELVPAGAVEVAAPPPHGLMKRAGAAWVETPESLAAKLPPLDIETLFDALKTRGVVTDADVGR